jgi:hypothetical protein
MTRTVAEWEALLRKLEDAGYGRDYLWSAVADLMELAAELSLYREAWEARHRNGVDTTGTMFYDVARVRRADAAVRAYREARKETTG